MEVKIDKGKVLFFCKNKKGFDILILMMCVYILFMVISIFCIEGKKLSEGLTLLIPFLLTLLIMRWIQNFFGSPIIVIYENGIEVGKQWHIFKKLYISFDEIKTIFPIYRHDFDDKRPFEEKKINFAGFSIILKNNKRYILYDDKFKENKRMAYILRSTIGDKWDNIFDKHYVVKYLIKKVYRWMDYINTNGKLPPNGSTVHTFKYFALAQLYDIETGKNTLKENIGEINEKYKDLWKNVEEIPDDFSW